MKKSRRGATNSTRKTKIKHISKIEIEFLKLLRIFEKSKSDIENQISIVESLIFEG